MSIETVPGTDLSYHLIAFDADGHERTLPDGRMGTELVLDALRSRPISDVFFLSHGWMGDVPAAKRQYRGWIGAMARCPADIAAMNTARGGKFEPLLIGLHWPSQPWGDEALGGAGAPSFGLDPAAASPAQALVDEYAARLADTPEARAALQTIVAAAMDDVAPAQMPPEVVAAYRTLDREAGMASDGVGAAPGADREAFDPAAIYRAVEDEAVSFGSLSLGGLLSPLRAMSFWKMKDRARAFGESGGSSLLSRLQANAPSARFHLMGHSFGCIVVSAMLAGPGGRGGLTRPADSLALCQGALSLWSYAAEVPPAPGKAGYFASIVADRRVRGPIVTTQSEHDIAVGRWYPLAAGVARQVSFAPGELPKYGAVGTYGLRGPLTGLHDLAMQPKEFAYRFQPGAVYNIESSQYIRTSANSFVGAHSDLAHPEVAHVIWEAARGA